MSAKEEAEAVLAKIAMAIETKHYDYTSRKSIRIVNIASKVDEPLFEGIEVSWEVDQWG